MRLNIQASDRNQAAKVYNAADPDRHDELDNPTHVGESPEITAIRRGQEAWCRLRAGLTWADWVAVGMAHVIGRTTAMRDGHINKPKGRSYNAAFSAWQKKFGFESLDKGDRARLFDVMDHLRRSTAGFRSCRRVSACV
jgi:hypothetical protein